MRRPSAVIGRRRVRAAVQRAEPLQQFARGGERAGRRRIDEAQVGLAPRRQFERQPGQFDLRDLGPALRFQPLRLRPQPVGPALGDAAGAAGALVGRGLRDGDDVEPREAAVGVVARLAREARVDHHAHAGQGHAGLGDVGRQHHAAAAVGIGLQHARLLLDRQLAVQGQHVDAAHLVAGRQRRLDARDLALAGQEHQHVARVLRRARARPRAAPAARAARRGARGSARSSPGSCGRRCSAAARRGTARAARRRASPTSPRCAGRRAAPPARRAPAPGRGRRRGGVRGTRRTRSRRRLPASDRPGSCG